MEDVWDPTPYCTRDLLTHEFMDSFNMTVAGNKSCIHVLALEASMIVEDRRAVLRMDKELSSAILFWSYETRSPNDHTNKRILQPASRAQDKRIPEAMVCRILRFMRSFQPLS